MNIKKIEQEADWFMGDKDNQQHLAEYVPDLLTEIKRLRVEATYYRGIIFRYRNRLEHLRDKLDIYARFGDFDDLTQREEEELKHLSVWERTKMTLTTMVGGINQLLEAEK
jgi:hypothetical protein